MILELISQYYWHMAIFTCFVGLVFIFASNIGPYDAFGFLVCLFLCAVWPIVWFVCAAIFVSTFFSKTELQKEK